MTKMTKASFREATKFTNIFNKIVKWNGYTLATVMWHGDREWKVIEPNTDFETISERAYIPIAEFHTQEQLWAYIK